MPDLAASLGKSSQEGEFSQLLSQHGKENGRYSVEGPVSVPLLSVYVTSRGNLTVSFGFFPHCKGPLTADT